jgi:hypothetical protein
MPYQDPGATLLFPIGRESRPDVPTQLLLLCLRVRGTKLADFSALENPETAHWVREVMPLADQPRLRRSAALLLLREKKMYFCDWVLSMARCYMKVEAHHMGCS